MLNFALAVLLLIITPGPGVLSTAGFGVASGFRRSLRYVLGLFVGTNLIMLCVITGVAAIVFSVPWLRIVLLSLSTIYLAYLAFKIAFAGSKVAFIDAQSPPGFLGGVMLQVINPKAYAVNTTLFSGFQFAPDNLAFEVTSKILITNLIWIPIHLLWLWAGVKIRALELSRSAQKLINYAMATALLLVAILALYSLGGQSQ